MDQIPDSLKVSTMLQQISDKDQFQNHIPSDNLLGIQQQIQQSPQNSISNQVNNQPIAQEVIPQDVQQNHMNIEKQLNNQDESIPDNIFDVKMGIKKQYSYSLEKELSLSMRLRYNKIYMNKEQQQIIPGIISIRANDFEKEIKLQPIDIIFVVDESGSMLGDPIDLVKKTLLKVLHLMKPHDRICIIGFSSQAQIHLNLTSTNIENKARITEVINKMRADGNTSISSGMQKAFEVLNNRAYKNEVASIFLLSDGQDNVGYEETKQLLENAKINDPFSIECFGYGQRHDSKLMTNICNLKQGTFNFVQDIEQIEFAFSTTFAGIISSVAQFVSIVVNFGNTEIMNGLTVSKTYGDQWSRLSHNCYSIKLDQLMAGSSKDYVFEICIPPFEMLLPDEMKFQKIVVAEVTAKCLNSKQEIKKSVSQTIEFLHSKFTQEQLEEDGEVMENYCRVIASGAMRNGQELANKGNYKESHNVIQSAIDQMSKSKYSNNQNIQELLTDLKSCQNACKQQNFNTYGQGYALSLQQNVQNQSNGCAFSLQASNLMRVTRNSNNAQNEVQQLMKNIQNTTKSNFQ